MAEQEDRRPELMEKASATMSRLSQQQREALLTKCWMAFDSRWFMAVAMAYGVEAAIRLNKTVTHEVGKAEAPAIVRALELPPIAALEDYLVLQEMFISLLGPKLMDYAIVQTSDDSFENRVQRCYAHENVTRAGVADQYECGIFSRVAGWLEALHLQYEVTPSPGKCLKAQGRECAYTFRLQAGAV
jgi:hypothetical protein